MLPYLTWCTGTGLHHWCTISFHNFTGMDWAGKFVGVSERHGFRFYLSFASDNEIVQTFSELGKHAFKIQVEMPERYSPLRRFVCRVYSIKSKWETLPEYRWELFRHKNLEGDKLPPTWVEEYFCHRFSVSTRDRSSITYAAKKERKKERSSGFTSSYKALIRALA